LFGLRSFQFVSSGGRASPQPSRQIDFTSLQRPSRILSLIASEAWKTLRKITKTHSQRSDALL